MTEKLIKNIVIIGAIVLGLITLGSGFISFSNQEIDLSNQFKQKLDERTAFYDKMYKVLDQKTQIAVKNDSSFGKIVNAQVNGQKNGEQLMWSWVQQSNPTATYGEVSKLYQDLSRAVEGEREGFFEQEKVLQDVVRQHSNLTEKFPGSFYNFFLNRKDFNYTPIKSDQTEEVMKTGKDNNTKLNL